MALPLTARPTAQVPAARLACTPTSVSSTLTTVAGQGAVQPQYLAALSEDSRRSLQLQGGVFKPEEAQEFLARPHAHDAVRVRLWDDLAKQSDFTTPPLAHYLACARRCLLEDAPA